MEVYLSQRLRKFVVFPSFSSYTNLWHFLITNRNGNDKSPWKIPHWNLIASFFLLLLVPIYLSIALVIGLLSYLEYHRTFYY